jgi:xanthine dehydrogenase YagR molybdenum-binding subunit
VADKRFVTTKVEVEGREEIRVVEMPEFEPAPWTLATPMAVVGQCVPRMDALEKVTGKAAYTVDVRRSGMLYAQIVRAPVAHGSVVAIDLTPALEVPGVRAVLGRDDVDGVRYDGGQLFDHTIRYAGQPLAAVCADTQEAADRGAAAVIVGVDAQPHAVTIEQSLAPNAPLVRSKGNTSRNSPRVVKRGDADAGVESADVVVHREYRTPCALHSAMEPHGAVAEWIGDHVTIWESTQGIFNTRSDVAAAFGLKLTQVRVIKEYMGGGFGAKNGAPPSTYVAVALARKAGAPVRCVLTREAEQMDSGNRSSTIQRVTIGAKRDGTLTAIVLDAEIAMGVGGWFAGPGRIYTELCSV